jgi:hypothetical protein
MAFSTAEWVASTIKQVFQEKFDQKLDQTPETSVNVSELINPFNCNLTVVAQSETVTTSSNSSYNSSYVRKRQCKGTCSKAQRIRLKESEATSKQNLFRSPKGILKRPSVDAATFPKPKKKVRFSLAARLYDLSRRSMYIRRMQIHTFASAKNPIGHVEHVNIMKGPRKPGNGFVSMRMFDPYHYFPISCEKCGSPDMLTDKLCEQCSFRYDPYFAELWKNNYGLRDSIRASIPVDHTDYESLGQRLIAKYSKEPVEL